MSEPIYPLSSLLQTILSWLHRKLTAAAIATVIMAIYLGIATNFRGTADATWYAALGRWLESSSVLLIYVAPITYIYGVTVSMLIELLLFSLRRFGLRQFRWLPFRWLPFQWVPYKRMKLHWLLVILSLLLHAFCGFWAMPLLYGMLSISLLGLASAVLFFVFDFALSKTRDEFDLSHSIRSFIFLPMTLFFVGMIGSNL